MSATNSSSLLRHFLSLLISLLFLSTTIYSDDRQTLLKIKTALQNPNTNVFDSWESNNSIFNFAGITSNPDGSVTEIELSNKNLTGVPPFGSICELKSLEKLSLGFNSLYGRVTEDLNNCVRLKYLDLGNNLFSEEVPSISSMNKLMFLYMNQSGFSGTFPWNSLENMTGLVQLSLGDNPFVRTPFPMEVVKLTQLNWLYLTNCSIEGRIPREIGNLTELINLELSQNFLSGEIPVEISKLGKLWQLELFQNELTGTLPVGFRNLTGLQKFDASTNYLTGDLSELRFSTQLVTLQLFENELTGEVPVEFGEFRQLVNLSLYTNHLTGSLPPMLGSWADFDFIDASENFLTGMIPPNMCKNGKMTELLLLQNELSGEIPASYANCTSLTRFRVSNNSLSGVVPSGIWGLPNVNIIDIELNQFEGPITSNIGSAKSLAQLFTANNRLSGTLPPEISDATALVSIDLSYNQFSGDIPTKIGNLQQLNSLHLQNNKFSGVIPASLSSCDSLSDLNMAENSLSGQIPTSIGSFKTLNSLNLSGNELSGQIPVSLSSLRLSLLDLSYNHLTGPIPESLRIEAYNGSFTGNNGLCSTQSIKHFRQCSSDSGLSKDLRTLIVCFSIGSFVLFVSLGCFFYSKKSQKDHEHEHSLKEDSWDVKSFHILSFTESEILDSIKQDNLIGKGGSGNVYKVALANGKELAVKHIWNNSDSASRKRSRSSSPMLAKKAGKSLEFDAEVETLSSIRHVNVVKLYCSITSEDSSLLVYEYLPNGSLWDRLHTCQKMVLDWETRFEIAVGAAKGLEYLHHGCDRPVIHRDVKSSNILLDEFLKPRIADFGLAKIVHANSSKDSTHVVAGTHGYIAPEYGYTYKVDEKSDVYSFGVVLMELVTGKRPIEPEFGENKDIVNWVCCKLKTRESVLSMVDSNILEAYKEDAIKVLKIAILCTTRLPQLRPKMRSVVQMLEEAEPCKLHNIIVSKDGAVKEEVLKGGDKV
ncbi:receptor-like protein kinase 7 [Cornus florida]|uniref:receptor-like protein kinase 7 n=1 Tax=Cornus florida TaxID=4283 RepID=UPI0028980BD4|nr:receptor-like protein kinase 7 [Cornus florida]